VRRLEGHLLRVLRAVAEAPAAPIRELPLLADEERDRLLTRFNATAAAFPEAATLPGLFHAQAERTPDADALACGGERVTFRDLDQRSNRLARHLRALGVGPEVRVGICAERSADLVLGLLGILKAGGAYVPLDPAYPAERLAFMVEDSAVEVVLTQERLTGRLPATAARVVCLDRDWPEIAARGAQPFTSEAAPDNLAYLIYTSGSTGRPKGVAIAHRSAVALLHWAAEVFGPEDRAGLLGSTSVCFDLSVFELFLPLCHGGTVVLVPNALALIEGVPHPVSLVNTVPSAIAELARQGAIPSSVRTIVLAGEPLPGRLVDELYGLPHVQRVFDCYGPSEDTTYSTWALREKGGAVTIGRPIANTRAYVLDAAMRPVPIGVVGELFIAGDGLARGYLNRPELTAERFVPDPFAAEGGGRLYRTGDLARYFEDGRLWFLGRRDHQVKLRGFRIELGEIEAALGRGAGVGDVVVVVREDEPGQKRLVGYVTGREGATLEVAELRRELGRRLPEYMVPSAIVVLPALPLSPNGKVDRRALPRPEGPASVSPSETPRTPAEEVLARIWSEVLRVRAVGVRDSFFELGGDSILSLQVVARAAAAGLRVSLRQLFEHPTVAELAAVAVPVAGIEAEQAPVTGEVALTPVQSWFFARALPRPHHFNQAVLLEPRRDVPAEVIEQALADLERHHDALRMRFARGPEGWRQTCAAPLAAAVLRRVDLGRLPEGERPAAADAAARETQAGLDLERGPVWRAALFEPGSDGPARLLIAVHHLVVDGVSWRVLLEDLQTACAQRMRGEPVRLPPKTTSFQRWAERLRAHAAAGGADAELPYWREVVRPDGGTLPATRPEGREGNTAGSARTVTVTLDEELTAALLQEVPAAYGTQIGDALLTALLEAVTEWTGRDAMLLDLEGHGREELFEGVDLSRTVGWFTTIYPVRLRRTASSPGEMLKSVKEQLRGVPGRGIGYGLLRELRGAELASGAELLFNYLGQFDRAPAPAQLFAPAEGRTGPWEDAGNRRAHLIEVNALVSGGRLRADWSYSEAVHDRADVEAVARRFEAALRALVEHCRGGAWGYTPSDFPLAELDQAELDRLMDGPSEVQG
jgi:amino acid adenylation domain-containing protein/non-ribosomal peptide synthase protein (TIGR01720 family)